MDEFPQSDAELSEIARRREQPPDEPYGAGLVEPDDGEHDCEECTRIVNVYQERREVCCTCGRVLRTVVTR